MKQLKLTIARWLEVWALCLVTSAVGIPAHQVRCQDNCPCVEDAWEQYY